MEKFKVTLKRFSVLEEIIEVEGEDDFSVIDQMRLRAKELTAQEPQDNIETHWVFYQIRKVNK